MLAASSRRAARLWKSSSSAAALTRRPLSSWEPARTRYHPSDYSLSRHRPALAAKQDDELRDFRGYDPPPFRATLSSSVDDLGGVGDDRETGGFNESTNSCGDANSDADSREANPEVELASLEAELRSLNGGSPLNPNSPKQVSLAVYGVEGRSTARDALLEISGPGRDVARLVLRYRELTSEARRQVRSSKTGRGVAGGVSSAAVGVRSGWVTEKAHMVKTSPTAAFSTDASVPKQTDVEPKVDVEGGDEVSCSDIVNNGKKDSDVNQSPYDRAVQLLFASPKSQIDRSWRPVIEAIVRPAARALVAQLNADEGCPMGYDPSAGPGLLSGDANTKSKTAGKKGTLLAYVREQKERYADCVVLTRVGEFYEAFGLDAALLVEHCGLNAMAGKARAGCPIRNIQPTLDCLTHAGLRVAVYEEAGDTDAAGAPSSGGAKSRLKSRMLAQIVTGANPTYLYDLVLGDEFDSLAGPNGEGDGSPSSIVDFSSAHSVAARPYVGVLSTAAGYTLVEVSIEERTARVSERLTAEAVACRLAAYPPAEPLFYVPPPGGEVAGAPDRGRLPFLPSRSDPGRGGGGTSNPSVRTMPAALLEAPAAGSTDAERAKRCVVSALLRTSEMASACGKEDAAESVTHEDFVLVEASESGAALGRTRTSPLYVETAIQLGLLSDPTIPPLVSYLLPDSAPAPAKRFLRRWLLVPPPPEAADAMSDLIRSLKDDERGEGVALPPLSVPPIGKVLALIRAGQASASVYRELLWAMEATVTVLEAYHLGREDQDDGGGVSSHERDMRIVDSLMVVLRYETGLASHPQGVRDRCLEAMGIIEGIVSVPHRGEGEHSSDGINNHGEVIPKAFFERNEAPWRGRVRPSAVLEAYNQVLVASKSLAEAVAVDFWGAKMSLATDMLLDGAEESKSPIVQDIFNNIIALKQVPDWASNTEKYHHPRDRNGKLLRNRYTTQNVESALGDYLEACEGASMAVTTKLVELSETLRDGGHLPAIVQAAHANLILSSAVHHAARANSLGWSMAKVVDAGAPGTALTGFNGAIAMHLEDMWPYWMDRTSSVHNTFTLEGLYLLTAPNMSGKSTLMRSTAVAALLANCGLAAPLSANSSISRFDSLFVRGASADVPSEDMSAFGAECGDVAKMLRSCGDRSLVFVDELGRGTSPRDGTALAGAVLEAMLERGLSGMFATHLHGILELPLSSVAEERLIKKRMAYHCPINKNDNNTACGRTEDGGILPSEESKLSLSDVEWTYKLEDGVCTDSLALVTAAKFGLPADVLKRAEALSEYIDKNDGKNMGASDVREVISCLSKDEIVLAGKDVTACNPVVMAKKDNESETCLTLKDAARVVESIFDGQEYDKRAFVEIPPRWMAPAAMEGYSCVYVIEINDEGKANGCKGDAPCNQHHRRFYVGETDSLSKRLRQHRAKGPMWANGAALAMRVPEGKSTARFIESLVIQKMAQMGFNMVSIADGRTVRSTGSIRVVNDKRL